jgi:Uma2 family endonuclease
MAMLEDLDRSASNNLGPAVAEPLLYEGQRLDQPTFHALYERMPEDFKAELIDGVVYLMNMPLHADHAEPDSLMIGCLVAYSVQTPGTRVRNNLSTKLGAVSEVQPDSCLAIEPNHGGRARIDATGIMVNAPELVVEISKSTLRRDLEAKKRVYEQAGALEYVVFDVSARKFHWFVLHEGKLELLALDADGSYHSVAFPGLWINEEAFASNDGLAAMAALWRGLASADHARFVEQLAANRANRP